jgi:hypothetical protein
MEGQDVAPDEAVLRAWYEFAAQEPGFVGSFLRLLRERQGKSAEDQQAELGIDHEAFMRLQGIPLPRARVFANDALRIAETCGLPSPLSLVGLLVLARNLATAPAHVEAAHVYQAAFDATESLDDPPEE